MQKPVLQALVLADHVYIDGQTGKKIIAGTFNRLFASAFPTKLGRTTWAYVCMTEVRGRMPVSLKYTDLQTNEVLLSNKPLEITSTDPLASHELVVEVPPFPMPHPGTFIFEIYAGEESIGSLRISVEQLKE